MIEGKKNKRENWAIILLIIAGATVIIRSILEEDWFGKYYGFSALLYVAIPFTISILLLKFTSTSSEDKVGKRLQNHFRNATIVLLAVSVIAMEGFICVLMFMPIYYFFMLLGFGFSYLREKTTKNGGRKYSQLFPLLLVAVVSLVGTDPSTSFNRYNEVSYSKLVNANIATLKKNMVLPIKLNEERHWFLKTFPLPTKIEANSLNKGDIHKIYFVYHKWFFTNTHTGEMSVRISDVGDDFVKTEIIENTSYLSKYMKIHGTEVRFRSASANQTMVTITVKFDRLLDPLWYFEPLERFAAEKSAQYLLENIIERKL